MVPHSYLNTIVELDFDWLRWASKNIEDLHQYTEPTMILVAAGQTIQELQLALKLLAQVLAIILTLVKIQRVLRGGEEE